MKLHRVSGGALLSQAVAGDTLALRVEARDKYLNLVMDSRLLEKCQIHIELESSQGKKTIPAQLITATSLR